VPIGRPTVTEPPVTEQPVTIDVGGGEVIAGDWSVPGDAIAVVVFAHGSGSSRRSIRNREVAAGLQRRGLATLLLDLLTAAEERVDVATAQYRFDIHRLAARLQDGVAWMDREAAMGSAPVGFFGASTGAAAALVAAAQLGRRIGAVVSRGGRPDLAGPALARVLAPTLLVVGGHDDTVLELNERAARELRCERELVVVPGATHLFEEPGALEQVARLAGDWFTTHLGAPAPAPGDSPR
jgi:pimeloyl-ACP methyl ester carboxylesterase